MPESKVNKQTKEKDHSYLQGQLLIAMPGLSDPYFEHSVTLICQHNTEGCFGLTINKPIELNINSLFDQLEIHSDNSIINEMPVYRGGPVQIEQGFVIHDSDNKWENTFTICDGLAVTASKDILTDIANGTGPDNFILTLGSASWAPGQMEQEILNNSWLNCPIDKKIIFNTPSENRWQSAADTLGFDMNFISEIAGHD